MSALPPDDPHRDAMVFHAGEPLASAGRVVILLHGRGGDAARTLDMARMLPREGVCFLSPAATENSWYPQRFLSPVGQNQPWLDSSLRVISREADRAAAAGVPRDRLFIGGFSQGGCLALEWALRTGGRLGGVFSLSGAVIGEPGAVRPHDRELAGTPVFIGCGDADGHIPVASVKESTAVLQAHGAIVTERIYPGLGHIIVSDEFTAITRMMRSVVASR